MEAILGRQRGSSGGGTSADDHAEAAKAQAIQVWSASDWSSPARGLEGVARELVEASGVGPGRRVLDVAAGDGNAALWAARAGASVVAVDFCPAQLERGRRRSAAEHLGVEWQEADMHDLPFDDHSFASVLCAFGITFARDQTRAVEELFRVAGENSLVSLVNWTTQGWAARMSKIVLRHLSGVDGTSSIQPGNGPARDHWGSAAAVHRMLGQYASTLHTRRGTVITTPRGPDAWWDEVRTSPLVVAAHSLPEPGFAALQEELVAAAASCSEGRSGEIILRSEYLIVVAGVHGPA